MADPAAHNDSEIHPISQEDPQYTLVSRAVMLGLVCDGIAAAASAVQGAERQVVDESMHEGLFVAGAALGEFGLGLAGVRIAPKLSPGKLCPSVSNRAAARGFYPDKSWAGGVPGLSALAGVYSEQRQLALGGGYAAWAVEETVGGGEEFDVVSVALDLGDETDGAEDPVEGVADVFEFGVEFVAAMLEPVLEAFEQIGREVGAIAGGIAMGTDGFEAFCNQRLVASRRAGKPTGIEPASGPGERVQQHAVVTVEVGRRCSGIKSLPDHLEQFRDGALQRGGTARRRLNADGAGFHGRAAEGRGLDSQGSASRAAWRSAVVTARRPAIAACSMARCSRVFTVRGLPWADCKSSVSAAGSKGLARMPTSWSRCSR